MAEKKKNEVEKNLKELRKEIVEKGKEIEQLKKTVEEMRTQIQGKEKTDEANLTAKHRPVIEKTKDGLLIKVGSVPHPMEKEHHIEWIEVLSGDKTYRQTLKPGGKPEAIFCLKEARSARIYCNIHGLWKN